MKKIVGIVLRASKKADMNLENISDFVKNTLMDNGLLVLPILLPKPISFYSDENKSLIKLEDKEKEYLDNLLDMCSGFVLPGGKLISQVDLYVLDYAIKKDKPILGICLGMQIMSLYKKEKKDLVLIENTNINHYMNTNNSFCHNALIDNDSKLFKIIGNNKIPVNSFHKYHVLENKYFKVSAKSDDGFIEAIEYPNKKFVIGVQWHPEKTYKEDIYSQKLFKYFTKIINEE